MTQTIITLEDGRILILSPEGNYDMFPQYEKALKELEAKYKRQQETADATKEMIDAIKALATKDSPGGKK